MEAGKAADSGNRRLSSWKEIASFFDCDERTVKRWETTRGLPVRRVPNGSRSPVFAYERELRAWLDSHREARSEIPEPPHRISERGRRSFHLGRTSAVLLAVFGLALIVGGAFALRSFVQPRTAAATSARVPLHQPSREAQAFYRAGLFQWQTRTPSGLRHAVDDFTQAIVRDPEYAEAYAGLAQCYELLREYTTVTPDYAFPRAKAAADRAIALNPSLPDAHLALAFADFYWFHDTATARREFARAIALSPGNAVAHHWYATFLLEMAEFPKAIDEIDKAATLDTESTAIQADRGLILFYAGHETESVALLRQLEQAEPSFASTHRYLAKIDLAEHDETGFLRELSLAAAALEDADAKAVVAAGEKGLAVSGRDGMLRAMLRAQEVLVRDGKGSAYALAELHAGLGDGHAAMASLRQSLSRGEADITGILIEPSFRPLRTTPEFRQLAQEAGVAPRS
jgi:Tfp pilus assembly protein PilF